MSEIRQVLANLEFLTVAEFLRYVETEARLEEFATGDIYSFQVVPKGIDALLKKKKSLLKKLERNNQKVSEWVDLHRPEADTRERAVLRSLYYQTRISINIVARHVRVAEDLRNQELLPKEKTDTLRGIA